VRGEQDANPPLGAGCAIRSARFFALVCALACGVGFPGATLAAAHHTPAPPSLKDRIQRQQQRVQQIKASLNQKRVQLHFRELHSLDLQRQLTETNRSIARVGASLETLNVQIRANERRLWWNSKQLDAAEATLARHNAALRRRLVDAYERGDVDYIEVLFSATSFSDFVERWDDIRFLITANQQTLRERQAAERAVSTAQRWLESERVELSNNVRRQQQDRSQLSGLAQERAQLAQVAEEQRRVVAHEVAQLEDLTAAQESELEALIRQEQAIEEARRAAERRAAQLAGKPIPPQLGAPAYFSWPVSGPITSPFGMRADPFGHGFTMHTGLDIGAPMGATITAAAGGRILFAGWYGGYGNAIIIDHGGSTVTLYGHCSQIFVGKGQDVQRGQAIGAVGSTGMSTGPHLHFEVRVNGIPVDPSGRLR
jgi:murein DD-endopeptidase MepM/ murein hydrolase activator NlpD